MRDHSLWDVVKAQCVPLGQPVAGDPIAGRLEPVQPRRKLDLHNLTIAEAYAASGSFVADAKATGLREIEIVTGRSGRIRAEFEVWAAQNPNVRSFVPVLGGGAYRIRL